MALSPDAPDAVSVPYPVPDPGAAPTEPHRAAAARWLDRLAPRVLERMGGDPADRDAFARRMDAHFLRLYAELHPLYGARPDFVWWLERFLETAARAAAMRPTRLKRRDAGAEAAAEPWWSDHRHLGAVCYVDRWAGDLARFRRHLDYLEELGVTYVHLMPLLKMRPGENDGGYAVSSYREVEPRIGTMAQLEDLAGELARRGMRLCLDFVFNHTADDHDWARAAKVGDPEARDLYRVFPDRRLPDAYQPHLREIFPDRGSDNFLWVPELDGWVWSTFYAYQWDLNFGNPALFDRMLAEMLFLANRGVEVLRLDAVPFIWKELGTDCENRPGAHRLIRAFNALAAMAAPALTFKSEAIVHPDQVASYVGRHEAPLSYHPLWMVHLWEMLATRDTRLARHAMRKRCALPPGSGWVNYVRGHDDIGWGFADEDAAAFHIDGFGHRQFLNAFYTGRFPGSFAGGLPFQENPRTGDCRIAGTTASLCGVERARLSGNAEAMDLAVRRVVLLHGLVLTMPGLPLIWLGDEVGRENDLSYRDDPTLAVDARWVHRPVADWPAEDAARADPDSPGGRIFRGIRRLAAVRRAEPALGGEAVEILPLANPHVFGMERVNAGRRAVVLANVTERVQWVADGGLLALLGRPPWRDLVSATARPRSGLGLLLEPYEIVVLEGLPSRT